MPRSILQRVVVDGQPSGIYIRRGYFITQGYLEFSSNRDLFKKEKKKKIQISIPNFIFNRLTFFFLMYNITFVGNLGKNIPIFFWNSYFADKKPCGNFCRPRVSIHRGTVTRQHRLEPLPSSRVETRLPRPWRFIFRSGNGGS